MTFQAFLDSLGLVKYQVVPDSTIRRCPTKDKPGSDNGAYFLRFDGLSGWGQNWALHSERVRWEAGEDVDVPEFDPVAHEKALEEHRAKLRAKRQKAISEVRAFWKTCKPLRWGHPYLRDHGLSMTGAEGLRVDRGGWLVVPLYYQDALVSVQRISETGQKLFYAGAPVKGAWFKIERDRATLTVLCEGLATGLAICQAMPDARAIVAFNAGNMKKVVDEVPTGFAVVASDNDQETEGRLGINPGVKAAFEAAEAIGCGVAVPEDIEGSDWADYRQEKYQEKLDKKLYETEGQMQREVDVAIRHAMLKNATFQVRRAA